MLQLSLGDMAAVVVEVYELIASADWLGFRRWRCCTFHFLLSESHATHGSSLLCADRDVVAAACWGSGTSPELLLRSARATL